MGVVETLKKAAQIRSAANEDDAFEKVDKLEKLDDL